MNSDLYDLHDLLTAKIPRAEFMETQSDPCSNSRYLVLELLEQQKETELVTALVTSVDMRLLSSIISKLKSCSMCQLPYNCGRVHKSKEVLGATVAELCVCVGRELVDTVLNEMAVKIHLEEMTEVTKVLYDIESAYGIKLSLSRRILGDTWPITRSLKKITINDVVPLDEREYVERCVSMLSSRSTVIVASPNTSFLSTIETATALEHSCEAVCHASAASKADMFNHPIRNAIGVAMKQAADIDQAYLLTGYDVFILEEPCIFCSMCLLHARVKRVFYSTPMEHNGGLNERLMIPALPGVNHRFPVVKFSWSQEVLSIEKVDK